MKGRQLPLAIESSIVRFNKTIQSLYAKSLKEP